MTARQEGPLRPIRGPEDFAAAFDVSRETIERLVIYEKLLRQWQKAVNLVAPSTLDATWHRHFADSAQLLPLAPPGLRSWIDLGSGAGFPGLVVAIMLAGKARGDGTHITLIESDSRKCAFLREVVRQTGFSAAVAVDILSKRAESVRIQVNETLPRVVSARALAPLDQLLGLAAPLSPPGTTGLFCKGKGAAKELQEAEKTWNFKSELVPSVTEKDGRVVVIRQLERKAKD